MFRPTKHSTISKHIIRRIYDLQRTPTESKYNSVLANSIPKSGTHLLTEVLESLGYRDYWGFYASTPSITMKVRPAADAVSAIQRIKDGEVFPSHMFFDWQILQHAQSLKLPVIQLIRDPCAIFVSELNYLEQMNRWHRYHRNLTTLEPGDERFYRLLFGQPDQTYFFPSFTNRIAPYLPWLSSPDVLTVKFEALRGVGFHEELQRIADYLSKFREPIAPAELRTTAKLLQRRQTSSHTFTGLDPERWRMLRSDLRSDLINEVAPVREQLGYSS